MVNGLHYIILGFFVKLKFIDKLFLCFLSGTCTFSVENKKQNKKKKQKKKTIFVNFSFHR